jgi:hypothetical protein
MNFDDFIDRYQVYTDIDRDLQEIVTLSKDTLRLMLTDLYTEAYNDGYVVMLPLMTKQQERN